MTRLFVLHADADATCADRIMLDLTTSGYHVDKDVQAFDAKGELQPYTPKLNLVGCAAVILLWSVDTPQAEKVHNALQFAQGMHKNIVAITLDNVLLPATLQTNQTITSSRATCDTLATSLAPYLPPTHNTDPLLTLYEQAIDASAPVRREAIERAEEMLQQGQHRKEVGVLLEILASDDTITSVSDVARDVLGRTTNIVPTLPPQGNSVPQQSQNSSFFTATCGNGHINTFDKHDVCSHTGDTIYRLTDDVSRGNTTSSSKQPGPRMEEVYLTCPTCGLNIYKKIDCAGY